MRTRQSRAATMLVAAAVAAWSGAAARADHIVSNWNTNAVGNWSNGSNWSTAPVFPNNGGGDTFDAVIDSAGADVALDTDITIEQLTLSAGALGGNMALTLNGGFDWLGGTLNGTGTIDVTGDLNLGGVARQFAGWTINLDAAAVTNWTSGAIDAVGDEGGAFNNAGTFDDQTDDGWFWNNTQTPVFNNTGTYVKSDGSIDSLKQFWPAFNNDGLVDVQTSDLWFGGGGHHTGTITVAAGARLLLSDFAELFGGAGAPTTTFASSAIVSSAGTVIFSNDFGNATTNFAGTYDSAATVIDPGELGQVHFVAGAQVNGGSLGSLEVLSGSVVFDTGGAAIGFTDVRVEAGEIAGGDNLFFSTFEWTGGTLRGTGASDLTTGDWTVTGPEIKSLIDRRIFNGVSSSAHISGGNVELSNGVILNLIGASIDVLDDVQFVNTDPDASPAAVVNSGLFVKSGGTGVSALADVQFENHGAARVESGTLRLAGGGTHSGAFEIAAGATLELAGRSIASTARSHVFQPGSTISGAAGSTLRINEDTIFDGGTFTAGTLAVESDANLVLEPGADKVLEVKSLSIDTPGGGRLDLADNAAIIDYTGVSPIETVRTDLLSGRNGGDWQGDGIVTSQGTASTFGIGYAESGEIFSSFPASFAGRSVDNTSVLLRFTRYGDANLDGVVNLADFNRLAANFGTSAAYWHEGDFNYDGIVNLADFNLLAANFGLSAAGPDVTPQDWANLAAAVPEPTAVLAPVVGALALSRRWRAGGSGRAQRTNFAR